MPTPSDEEAVSSGVTPMLGLDIAAPLRAAFTSCPPEENRGEQHIAPSGEEHAEDAEEAAEAARRASNEERATGGSQDETVGQTQAASTEAAAGERKGEEHLNHDATTHGAISEHSPSPAPSLQQSDRDSDARLAQSMSTAAISSSSPDASEIQTPTAKYLHFPELDRDRQTSYNSTTSFLRPGSKFRGTQQSDRQVYDVQVEVKDVDMAESFLCGYLRIQGLTDDHPTLTTFFEGEIIGPKYLFRTEHPTWGSNEKVDMQHWARFPAWRPLAKSALKSPSASSAYINRFDQREHLFMRWKEYFLVPDHRVKTITGASFEGFYYICFNQCSGTVSGIYFHAKSEKFQQLELRHVEDRGCMPAVEFR